MQQEEPIIHMIQSSGTVVWAFLVLKHSFWLQFNYFTNKMIHTKKMNK